MSTMAVVDDDAIISSPILSTMLTSSVLVTGALLVGTGDCTVIGNSISVSASIQTTSSGMLIYLAIHMTAISSLMVHLYPTFRFS